MTVAAAPLPPARAALGRVALRASIGLGGAVLVAALRLHERSVTVCPLRAVTGVPCPLCGGTTAAGRIGRGDVLGGLAANPVAVLAAALLVLAPVLSGRVRLPHRAAPWLFTVGVLFAWVWQLTRAMSA